MPRFWTCWDWPSLHPLIAEVLTGRTHYGMMPSQPHTEALQLHADVAAAIQRRQPEAAQGAMLRIMERAIDEMHAIWTTKV